MTQYARPDSDVDNQDDAWTNSDGGAPSNTLYTYIDEASGGSDYVEATDDNCDGAGVYFTVGLSNVTDPESASSHVIKAYIRIDPGTDMSNAFMRGELLEGSTVRATSGDWETDDTGALLTYTLSTAEANSISNYNNLRLRITFFDDECYGSTGYVDRAWFECPDAAAPAAAANGKAFMLFLDS